MGKKELKTKHKSEYPIIIEMYDIITMIVTQMINVERLNSARTLMDDDKTQRASFGTLNGRLRLWHGKGKNDKQVIQRAYKSWIMKKQRRMSHK